MFVPNRARLCSNKKTRRNCGFRTCTNTYQGSITAKYKASPGAHNIRPSTLKSRNSAQNTTTIRSARNGATGPLANVASARKMYAVASQRFWSVSSQTYHANREMPNMDASGMSVEAARANPMMLTEVATISAPSTCDPGRNRRKNKYTASTNPLAITADGIRAAQSLTPNAMYDNMAPQ